MRLIVALLASLLVAGCGGGDSGGPGDGTGTVDGSTDDGLDGGSSGGDSDGGSSSGSGDGGGSSGGGDATVDASSRTCGPELHGESCSGDETCTYSSGCTEGMCECRDGNWLCSEENVCGDMCPSAKDTSCGDSCSVDAKNCLCGCGGAGGPDFTSCDCVDGAWDCGDGCRG